MVQFLVAALFLVSTARIASADALPHVHPPDAPQAKAVTKVSLEKNMLTLTFGPIDLPAGHSGELASSMPIHFFKAPKDLSVVGYKSRIFTKDGKELPGQYLHHILLQNLEEKSLSCPG